MTKKTSAGLEKAIAQYNQAFNYHPGDLQVMLPVDKTTAASLSEIATRRGRKDIGDKISYEFHKPADEDIGAIVKV